MKKASVIIPIKNPGIQFQSIIESICTQITPWDYEILIIDSGSTDGSIELLNSYPNIQIHQIEPSDFGHGRTRNMGVSMTSGEFAVFLTHDALPANDKWLFELVNETSKDEAIAGGFGRHTAYQKDGPYIHRDMETHFNNFKQSPAVVWLDDEIRYDSEIGYRQFLHFYSNCNSCLRRSVWEKFPFPDVDFAEDQAWAELVIKNGYKKVYVDTAIVYHSHQYGFWQTFIRSFDESRALKNVFGYDLCPSLRHFSIQSVRTTGSDLYYSFRTHSIIKDRYWMLQSPLRNIFRQLGFFLGQRSQRLPDSIVGLISRDLRIQRS